MGVEQKPSVVMIGAGNVATHLAMAVRQAGYPVLQVYSRTREAAVELAGKLGAEAVTDLSLLDKEAGIYLASLKDDAFLSLIPEITTHRSQALFLHTAGSVHIDVWKGYARHYGVLYPLQTFSKQRPVDFREIPLFIEAASAEDETILRTLALSLSEKIYTICSEQRKVLHLAAVFACNFTNRMYELAAGVLAKYDLPFEILLPLIDETARKVHTLSPGEAQTGPAVRYDTTIIGKHLDMLADEPQVQEIYRLLSENIYRSKL
ncbi:MAG: DUF2520 domain-containing protein [Bacteroides sp.]|nr:DUF2520 domain-containing protein [Bacteroides sp.]